MEAKIVRYKGRWFLWYKTNAAGFAQLIDDQGKKYPGTPRPVSLGVVKTIPAKEWNKHWYVGTKQGVFSLSTGDKIVDPNIVKMFGLIA